MTADTELLLVDDDPASIQVLGRTLAGLGRLRFAMDGQAALAMALEIPPDLILLDAEMPGLDGYGVLEAMRDIPALAGTPTILVTGHDSDAAEQRALALGARDFMTKPVRPALIAARARTLLELRVCERELERLRGTDALTGLAGFALFETALAREESRTLRLARPLSLILVGVEGFAACVEQAGAAAGDRLLQQLATTLGQFVRRPFDLVARTNQARFALLLPDTPLSGARFLAENLKHLLDQSLPAPLTAAEVAITLGVSGRDAGCPDWRSVPPGGGALLETARAALQQAGGVPERFVLLPAPCS